MIVLGSTTSVFDYARGVGGGGGARLRLDLGFALGIKPHGILDLLFYQVPVGGGVQYTMMMMMMTIWW